LISCIGVVALACVAMIVVKMGRAEIGALQLGIEAVVRAHGGEVSAEDRRWGRVGSSWRQQLLGGVADISFHTTVGLSSQRTTGFSFRTAPGRVPRIELYPRRSMRVASRLNGVGELKSGQSAFDEVFIILANDGAWWRTFLTDDTRREILALGGSERADVSLHACSDSFELRVDGWLPPGRLVPFHDRCVELLERALAGRKSRTVAPIADLVPSPLPFPSRMVCLVCGDGAVERPVVRCRLCDSPHHDECWRYNGRCAVYACGGTRKQDSEPRVMRQ
jgi:hypothetical protein